MLESIKDLLIYYNLFDFSEFAFSSDIIFMLIFAFIWISVAIIEDFKRREIENWWNFSLIAIILAFRSFWSVRDWNYWILLWGFIGLIICFIFANAFYYARVFAGGDAKLLIALGAILPLSLEWRVNIGLLALFIIFLVFAGAIYGLGYSFVLTFIKLKKIRRETKKMIKNYKKLIYFSLIFGITFALIVSYFEAYLLLVLAFMFVVSPFLYLYASVIEKTCLNKLVSVMDLTIGDWLVDPIKVKGKVIKPNWEGLSDKELKFIRKNYERKVLVRYGIPFTPAFLIAFTLLVLFLI